MTKKHFVFAADNIIDDCYMNGINKEQSAIYQEYIKFFNQFGNDFNQDTFDAYIEKGLNNYK
jgi:hypothetical protein